MRKSGNSLERTMMIYFLLIMLVSLVVGVEFILDIQKPELRQLLLHNLQQYSVQAISLEQAFAPLDNLRDKAVLMFIIIMCVMLIIFTMFIKNITEPLQHMIEVSREISEGNMSHVIQIENNNELAELGAIINDMASNLQEIVLLAQNVNAGFSQSITEAEALFASDLSHKKELSGFFSRLLDLKGDVHMFEIFVNGFHFYSIEQK